MQGLGYEPQVNYTTRSNHFYGDGNIGFYLKNAVAGTTFVMPKKLRTTQCSEDKYNDLLVTFTDKYADFTLPSGAVVRLGWEFLYGYVVIYYKNYSQTYSHSQPLINTPFGAKAFRYLQFYMLTLISPVGLIAHYKLFIWTE